MAMICGWFSFIMYHNTFGNSMSIGAVVKPYLSGLNSVVNSLKITQIKYLIRRAKIIKQPKQSE